MQWHIIKCTVVLHNANDLKLNYSGGVSVILY